MASKYTRRADRAGWLTVKLNKTGLLASLCEYTKVEVLRRANHRTYFTIMDGYVSPGEEASLSDANAALYLATIGPAGAASLSVVYQGKPAEENSKFKGKLTQQWAKLTFNDQTALVTLIAFGTAVTRPFRLARIAFLHPIIHIKPFPRPAMWRQRPAWLVMMSGSRLALTAPCRTAVGTFMLGICRKGV